MPMLHFITKHVQSHAQLIPAFLDRVVRAYTQKRPLTCMCANPPN